MTLVSNGGARGSGGGGGDLKSYVERNQGEIAKALPEYVGADRFFKLLVTELVRNPEIQKCSPNSVIESIYQCARLGLSPGPAPIGKIHLVRFGEQCTTIIDYKGLIDLAKRSGRCKDIRAYVVYQNELDAGRFAHKACNTPNPPTLYHEPIDFGDRGEPVGAYAIAYFDDRDPTWQIMSIKDIDKAKAMSRGSSSAKSPWNSHWEEMAKKTVIRRLCKFLDLNDEVSEQLVREDAVTYGQRDLSTTVSSFTVANIEDRSSSVEAEEKPAPAKKRGRPSKIDKAREWLAGSGLTVPEIRDILKVEDASPGSLTVEQIEDIRVAYEEKLAIQESM